MNPDSIDRVTTVCLTAGFLALAAAFCAELWGRPRPVAAVASAPAVFSDTNTVRLSSAELIQSGADTSGMECYACHEQGKRVTVRLDDKGSVVVSLAHRDLVFARLHCQGCHDASEGVELKWNDDGSAIVPEAHKHPGLLHGRNNRNDHCFNCHDPDNLKQLRTIDGRSLKFEQSTLLCAGCHGPTFRDWEAGIHGRTTGFWDGRLGPTQRKDCASCHDPHAPSFPSLKPGPRPQSPPPPRAPARGPANKLRHD